MARGAGPGLDILAEAVHYITVYRRSFTVVYTLYVCIIQSRSQRSQHSDSVSLSCLVLTVVVIILLQYTLFEKPSIKFDISFKNPSDFVVNKANNQDEFNKLFSLIAESFTRCFYRCSMIFIQ